MEEKPKTGKQLRLALEEVRTSIAQTKGETSTMKAIEDALASGDEDDMRSALAEFDLLSTQQIQIMRKLPSGEEGEATE